MVVSTAGLIVFARRVLKSQWLGIVALPLAFLTAGPGALAPSSCVADYDSAGNVIAIRVAFNVGAPVISSLPPPFINQNQTVTVTGTSSNIGGADVPSTAPDITVLSTKNLSASALQFTLSAATSTPIGNAAMTFTTDLGQTDANVAVVGALPIIVSDPNPIGLRPDSIARTVTLRFAFPYATTQTYDLAIVDASIASVSTTQVLLAPGETELSLTQTGLTRGTTALSISQLSNFFASSFTVIVQDMALPVGPQFVASRRLGVRIALAPTAPVGDVLGLSPALGVRVQHAPSPPPGPQLSVSAPLGVRAALPTTIDGPATSWVK